MDEKTMDDLVKRGEKLTHIYYRMGYRRALEEVMNHARKVQCDLAEANLIAGESAIRVFVEYHASKLRSDFGSRITPESDPHIAEAAEGVEEAEESEEWQTTSETVDDFCEKVTMEMHRWEEQEFVKPFGIMDGEQDEVHEVFQDKFYALIKEIADGEGGLPAPGVARALYRKMLRAEYEQRGYAW